MTIVSLLQLLLLLLPITETYTMSVVPASSASATAAAAAAALPPRIAVIGAGAAGLACSRIFSRAGWEPTVFEKSAAVGGVWNYQAGDKERPMYQGLRTNLPKEVMAFRECPWTSTIVTTTTSPDDLDSVSYVTHRQVLEYLQAYTKKFNLKVQYERPVKHLKVLPKDDTGKKSSLSPPTEDWPQIELLVESSTNTVDSGNKLSMSAERQLFDAVVIANGHYGVPSIPHIPGVKEHFKGRTMHSVEYDDPKEFENQTVLCIGARASGSDIARELASNSIQVGGGGVKGGVGAKKVYLSDSDRTDGKVQTLGRVSWVPRTVSILESGAVQFDHDCPLQPNDIDVIIYCTGYDYVFPFIDEKSNIVLDAGNRRVMPLYEQLWHAQYPNVVFVGLPHSIVPFPVFELQAEATLQTWKTASSSSARSNSNDNDTADVLPNLTERLEAAKKAAEAGGEGKPNGHVPRDTHYLGNAQWDYCRRMARIAGIYDETVEDYIATNKKLYDEAGNNRKGEFPGGPDHYREKTFSR